MNPLQWTTAQWAKVAAGVAVLLYLPSLWNGFAYDDLPIIVRNQAVHGFSQVEYLLTTPYWPGEQGADFGLWRPVTSLVMAFLWMLGNGAAWTFHLANVALHAAVTFLVVRLLARMFPAAVAGLAGVVFAIHPVHVEAVANGVGLAELLAAALGLLALDLALELDVPSDAGMSPGTDSISGTGSSVGLRAQLPVLVLFAFAFGAKEGAIVMPGLLVLADAYRGRLTFGDLPAWLRRRGVLLGGLTGVAGVMLWIRSGILGSVADPLPPLGADILPEIPRIWTLGEIWAQTLRIVTVPTWLTPEYGPAVIRILTVWTPIGILGTAGLLTVLGIGWISARRWGRRPSALWGGIAFGVGWFVIAVSPVSNVLFVAGVLVAERTLYLPSIGVAVVAAAIFAWLFERPALARPSLLAFGGLAAFWALTAVTYIPKWSSQEEIFAHMIQVTPQAGRAQWVLGDLEMGRGNLELALQHYRTALTHLGPEYVFLSETGRRLIGAGQGTLAKPFLARAWEVKPSDASAPQLLAVASSQLQDWPSVQLWAERAIDADDEDLAAWHLLSVSHAARGEWSDARSARESLLERGSREAWQQWFWLTELRARSGDPIGALAAADSARLRTEVLTVQRQIDSLVVALELPARDP